jgi:hypothetical protein
MDAVAGLAGEEKVSGVRAQEGADSDGGHPHERRVMTFFYEKGRRRRGEFKTLHVFAAYEWVGVVRAVCGTSLRFDSVVMKEYRPLASLCRWCPTCKETYLAELVALKLGEEDGKRANGKMG